MGPDSLDPEQLEDGFDLANELSDTLCRTCGNTSCPLDDKRATQCVEYYPLNNTEDACPTPTTTTT